MREMERIKNGKNGRFAAAVGRGRNNARAPARGPLDGVVRVSSMIGRCKQNSKIAVFINRSSVCSRRVM